MKLRQLRYFVALNEASHFTRVVARANHSHPQLSRQIGALEEWLDATLFERTVRGVHLTAVGRTLLAPARLLPAQALRFTHLARPGAERNRPLPFGKFWQRLFHVEPLAGVITPFRQRLPEVPIGFAERRRSALHNAAAMGELDVTLTYGAANRFPGDALVGSETLSREDCDVAFSPRHGRRRFQCVPVAELAHASVLRVAEALEPEGTPMERDAVRSAGVGLYLPDAHWFDSTEACIPYLQLGPYVAVAPLTVIRYGGASERLVTREVEGVSERAALFLLFLRQGAHHLVDAFRRASRPGPGLHDAAQEL